VATINAVHHYGLSADYLLRVVVPDLQSLEAET
jgi:hypothetical protein